MDRKGKVHNSFNILRRPHQVQEPNHPDDGKQKQDQKQKQQGSNYASHGFSEGRLRINRSIVFRKQICNILLIVSNFITFAISLQFSFIIHKFPKKKLGHV